MMYTNMLNHASHAHSKVDFLMVCKENCAYD